MCIQINSTKGEMLNPFGYRPLKTLYSSAEVLYMTCLYHSILLSLILPSTCDWIEMIDSCNMQVTNTCQGNIHPSINFPSWDVISS